MSHARSLLIRLLPLLALLAFGVGCSEEQPAVNRVQPNVVEKNAFDGDWYYLKTVIDTPYGATYTFVGEQGKLEKIRWEVQEQYLIARRSYDFISNSESGGISGAAERGAAVAMYKVESHFDIRREYNPVTGEEMNVVVENSTDRPWYQRQFMRVDWSENLITDTNLFMIARIFDGIEAESVSYFVQDLGENHPHAPKFVENDDGSVGYMDIVNKMFVRPTSVEIEGFGDVPSCFLLTQSHLDCAPGEITVRNSFLKVDPAADYQPMMYTGDRMDRFGYFVTERAGYDDHYGAVEPARHRFVNRHDVWKASHKSDGQGGFVRCTAATADVCGGNGSVCDVDFGRAHRERADSGEYLGACTIPYREREVQQIPYHVSRDFPADLVPDAENLARDWNTAFADMVGSLRELECVDAAGCDAADSACLDGARAGCAGERARPDAQDIFVLCHNPVAETDHAACGERGAVAEIGDLRHSLIGWVSEPHVSSPLGYGPSAADPETGEIVMANAFVYGAAMETLSSFARDIVGLLNRDLTETDVSDDEIVAAWIERQVAPGSEITGRPADDHAVPVDGFDVERVAEAMDFSWAKSLGAFRGEGARIENPGDFIQAMERSRSALTRGGAFGNGTEVAASRLTNLLGTDIERMMVGPEMMAAAGIDPRLPITDDVIRAASPLQGMSVDRMEALRNARALLDREACVLQADFADEGLVGLARAIKRSVDAGDGTFAWYGQNYQLYGEDGLVDYERVRTMLRHPIFYAVTQHEVGHTLGLRHNFSGSFDALNYFPRYWDLRDDGNMLPRAWDPMTEAERDGRILEAQYSTVMDYGVNFVVTDAEGIGHYDRAAIKMGYGDIVEVFTDAPRSSGLSPSEISWYGVIQALGYPVPITLSAASGGAVGAYTYTDLPRLVGGRENLQRRADVHYTSLTADPVLARSGLDQRVVDPEGRPAVPYMFCSDEQGDLSPSCLRYDQGADSYETVQSVIDNYWNYYVFNAFRRGRLGFDPSSYVNRVHGRYFTKLKYANQIYSLYRGLFDDMFTGSAGYDTFWTRPDGMGAWTAAVGSAFQLFTRVITTPEPGSYGAVTLADGSQALSPGGRGGVTINGFDGRYLETTWNFDAGYFWFDQTERAGFFFDKAIALMVLADPQTNFLGRDSSADIRRYQINFNNSFSGPLTSFMRGLIGEDWNTISPRAEAGEGAARLTYPDALDLAGRDMGGLPIDPNASFSIQLYAMIYGMAMLPQTFDQTYINRSRIFVRGGAEGVDLDPAVPVIEFTDPVSGLTYVAASYLDERGRETGVGAQMLNHARALATNGSSVELARYVDNINIVRRLTWMLGFGVL